MFVRMCSEDKPCSSSIINSKTRTKALQPNAELEVEASEAKVVDAVAHHPPTAADQVLSIPELIGNMLSIRSSIDVVYCARAIE